MSIGHQYKRAANFIAMLKIKPGNLYASCRAFEKKRQPIA